MINNDYIRGYFDAHGRIWVRDVKRKRPQWCIEFQDRDLDQLSRIYEYLKVNGYTIHLYSYTDTYAFMGKKRKIMRNRLQMGAMHDVLRFIKEINSERLEWKERFKVAEAVLV